MFYLGATEDICSLLTAKDYNMVQDHAQYGPKCNSEFFNSALAWLSDSQPEFGKPAT